MITDRNLIDELPFGETGSQRGIPTVLTAAKQSKNNNKREMGFSFGQQKVETRCESRQEPVMSEFTMPHNAS